jgi:hypothetical protein
MIRLQRGADASAIEGVRLWMWTAILKWPLKQGACSSFLPMMQLVLEMRSVATAPNSHNDALSEPLRKLRFL